MQSTIVVLFALLVTLNVANPTACDGDCSFLPVPCFVGKVTYPGTNRSYVDVKINENGGLLQNINNGTYHTYCIEMDANIRTGSTYNWASQSSLDRDFVNIMKYGWGREDIRFENIDNVNWLLTHIGDYSTSYTASDFQNAIWKILFGRTLGGNTVRVNQLVSDATGNGDGFYPNHKDHCYGIVFFPSNSDDCYIGTGVQTQYTRICFKDLFPCTVADPNNLSAQCNNHGYCLEGETNKILACSCVPGYTGRNCETELPQHDSCVTVIETPTASTFQTTVGGNIDECGNIHLTIETPIENSENEDSENFAAWTRLIFKNQDSCDYPESTRTFWDIVDSDNTCFQKYEACTSFEDLIRCIGDDAFCRDGETVIPCNPVNCTTPPCDKCYRGQIQANRAYVRTSENGLLSDTATAENCHYFQVCLPWVQQVDTNILVFKQPDLNNEMIVGSVSYSCFNDVSDCPKSKSWTISILSSVGYPFSVQENAEDSGKLVSTDGTVLPLYSITDKSGCGVTDEFCVQELKFLLPGCDSLETTKSFTVVGFKYGCYDSTDSDCTTLESSIDPKYLNATADLQLTGTQDNCGHDLTIDGVSDSISLDMASFLDDYETANTVFVYATDADNAFFKINVKTSVDVSSVSIVTLKRTIGSTTTEIDFEVATCPDPTADELADAGDSFLNQICFKVDFEGLGALLSDNSLFTVNYAAKVELNYGFRKRQVGLNTGYELNKNIRILNRAEESSSAVNSAVSVAAAIVPFGLMFL